MAVILFSGPELLLIEYREVGKKALADVSALRDREAIGNAAGHFSDRSRHGVAGAVQRVFEKFGEAVVNGGVLHAVRLDPGVGHIETQSIAGKVADDLRRAVRAHIDAPLEIAHLAEIKIGVNVGFSHFFCNLRNRFALVLFVPLTDVGDGDIVPAEAEQHDARFGKQGEAELVHGTALFLGAERLIPCRHDDGDDGYAEQLAVYIELCVHTVFSHSVYDLLELILAAERTAAYKDRVRVLELHVRAAGDFFQLVQRTEKVRPSEQGIGHGYGAARSRMHGHRPIISLGETRDLFQLIDRNIKPRLVHQPKRYAAGALFQALLHNAEHLLLLMRRQIAPAEARDTGARGTVTGKNRNVARRVPVHSIEQRTRGWINAGLLTAVAEKPAADLVKMRRIRRKTCSGETAVAGNE